jgi:hypothetical protein
MQEARRVSQSQEPIGIVISRGSRDEVVPKFSAYVWAPAPDDERAETKAA